MPVEVEKCKSERCAICGSFFRVPVREKKFKHHVCDPCGRSLWVQGLGDVKGWQEWVDHMRKGPKIEPETLKEKDSTENPSE